MKDSDREVVLLHNGSLQRKMGIIVALVLGMLIALSVGALTGLASYRRLVRELSYSIYEAPRRADVAEAVGGLFDPLLGDYPNTLEGADTQRRAFQQQLAATRRKIVDFHRRLDQRSAAQLPMSQKQATERVLKQFDERLALLETEAESLGDPEVRETTQAGLMRQLAALQTLTQQIPDDQSGLHESLSEAKKLYRSRVRLVAWTGGVGIILFAIFGYSIYAGIIGPVRKLHQGAKRVAEGDLQYALDIPGRGEMAELAEAFNTMTARFQEAQQELKDKVEERSRQLMRSERLANIGFLAAGVAHEINNPLSAISMAADSLMADASTSGDSNDNSVQKTYLAMISRESERCKEITRKLLDFAHGKDGERTRVDLTQLVNEVLEMIRPMTKYRNRHIEFFRTEPCYAEVNGPEIKQVVLNIVSNALESTADNGTVRLRLVEQVDAVTLICEDDGCGMSEEVRDQLFEPFFTQRRDGRGTGLGLAITQRIVQDHHGTIEADSPGPDRGSTFRVELPRRAISDSQSLPTQAAA